LQRGYNSTVIEPPKVTKTRSLGHNRTFLP
jgi:hypothetical protein